MPVLRDQRSMTGPTVLTTIDEVRAVWEQWGREAGFIRQGVKVKGAETVVTGIRLAAYVSQARWVADCPVCGAGMAGWPDHDQSCCLNCGCVFSLDYPPPREIAEAEAALAARPDDTVRNWRPDQGETAKDARHENIKHGYQPADESEGAVAAPPKLAEALAAQLGGGREAQDTLELLRSHGVI